VCNYRPSCQARAGEQGLHFASILSVYLLGTAIGDALYARPSVFSELAAGLLQATAVACLVGLGLLWAAEPIYSVVRSGLGGGFTASVAGKLAVSALVFLLPTLAMGATFTHIAQGARDKTDLGVALGVNTLGAAFAPFLFGILLLPVLGSKTTLILLSLGYLHSVAFGAADESRRRQHHLTVLHRDRLAWITVHACRPLGLAKPIDVRATHHFSRTFINSIALRPAASSISDLISIFRRTA
jgi:hypothetical protein